MEKKYRATMHNGRTRKSGEAYSVKHNDRNCPVADNINPTPERRNRYFTVNADGTIETHPDKTFEQHEKDIYNKALKELAFERPDKSKPQDRHNNPKMAFTQAARDVWIAAARQYGIEIEEEPAEPGKTTLTREKYIADTIRAETTKLRAERQELQEQIEALTEERTRLSAVVRALKRIAAPFKSLVDKLARLVCIDGESALFHVMKEVNAITEEITVYPNVRVRKYLQQYLVEIRDELRRMLTVSVEDQELATLRELLDVIERL